MYCSIDNAIKEICKDTSLTEEEVKSNIEDWVIVLMSKGVIVNLEIKRWRAKIAMLEEDYFPEIERENDDWIKFSQDYIDFGKKLILPKRIDKELLSLESNGRRTLKTFSFDTVWGRFVPCSAFTEWHELNEKIKESYFSFRDKLCSTWDAIKLEIIDEYRVFCKKIYKKNKIKTDYKVFEENFLSKIESNIITSDELYKSFIYDSIYYYIPIPSEVQFEFYKAEKILDKRENLKKEAEMKDFIHQETMKKKSEHIDKFLKETVFKIREMMLSIIEDVKSAILLDRSCVATGSNRMKLLNMIEKVRRVDFFSDEAVSYALDKLQTDLEKESKYRSEDEIIRSLKELEALAKTDINKIALGRSKLLEL